MPTPAHTSPVHPRSDLHDTRLAMLAGRTNAAAEMAQSGLARST